MLMRLTYHRSLYAGVFFVDATVVVDYLFLSWILWNEIYRLFVDKGN